MKKYIFPFTVLSFGVLLVGCGEDSSSTIYETNTYPDSDILNDERYDPSMDPNNNSMLDTTTDAEAAATTRDASLDTSTTINIDADAPVMNPTAAVADPQTSRIIFPNGSEILEVGKAYTIRWESEGIEAVDIAVSENGRSEIVIAERVLAYNGVLEWTPSAQLLGDREFAQFMVSITDADTGEKHDTSDKAFIVQLKADQ